jgi:7-cyano-7-deazaguanine synthase
MKDKLAIVSGGMDSVTMLYCWKDGIAMAISFNYGQKHSKEIYYAKYHCNQLSIPWKEIHLDLPMLKSSLMVNSQEQIPNGHYTDESMKSTVVPFRNGIMLSIAVGIAESNDLSSVMMANHSGDHAIYPDCRPAFTDAFNKAAQAGTYGHVAIFTPFINMTKRGIAVMGKDYNVPFENTWSCYKGGDTHCGKCGTCIERKEALYGFDLTKYKEEE